MTDFLIRYLVGQRVEILEAYLVLFAIVVSFAVPRLASAQFKSLERAFAGFARHRTRAVLSVGILALVVRALVLPLFPVPEPSIHDEFENLLMADTFAHFHVTNPTHPISIHFETFHVLQTPSYTGINPPAQGLFLAAGQVFGGHPFVGVWLSVGIMCAAICWMLQGWLPPAWALLGGLLVVMRFGVVSYWSNSYWGGAVAATAGAIVLGSLPRIWKHARVRDAVFMGVGIAILANSRPYEGFVLSIPVAVGLFAWMAGRKSPPWQVSLRRVVLPISFVLVLTGGAMAYYNWRVTGSPVRTAYEVNMATVNPVPYFIWQAARPIPAYHFKEFENLYLLWAMPQYQEVQSFDGWAKVSQLKLKRLLAFYFGIALEFPIILAIVMGGFSCVFLRRLRFLSVCLLVSCIGLLVEVQYLPHYVAPLTGVFIAFVLQSMRYVRVWGRRDRAIGLLAMRCIPLICAFSLAIVISQVSIHYYATRDWPHGWYSAGIGNLDRARLLVHLDREPGQHLVIVRYSASHSVHNEWVYNKSDIDGAKVVWARDMGLAGNQELIDYFRNRHIWLLEADKLPSTLVPYPVSTEPVNPNSPKKDTASIY